MEDSKIKETGELKRGVPMSEEDLAEFNRSFQDIEESIDLVMKNGEDL
jgi:hypothetical protein